MLEKGIRSILEPIQLLFGSPLHQYSFVFLCIVLITETWKTISASHKELKGKKKVVKEILAGEMLKWYMNFSYSADDGRWWYVTDRFNLLLLWMMPQHFRYPVQKLFNCFMEFLIVCICWGGCGYLGKNCNGIEPLMCALLLLANMYLVLFRNSHNFLNEIWYTCCFFSYALSLPMIIVWKLNHGLMFEFSFALEHLIVAQNFTDLRISRDNVLAEFG